MRLLALCWLIPVAAGWRALAWQRLGPDAAWPEKLLPELAHTAPSGLCLAGGGSRAFTAAIGLLTGLGRTPGMAQLRYLAGVSGGAWAATLYSYSPRNASQLLGSLTSPRALELARLAQIPIGSARRAATSGVIERAIEGFLDPRVPDDRFWDVAVGRVFLEPFGINQSAGWSWSPSTVARLRAQEPGLANRSFLTVARPAGAHRPFPLVGVALEGPAELAPLKVEGGGLLVEASPLYVGMGSPAGRRVFAGCCGRAINLTVGGMLEPHAFGAAVNGQPGLAGRASGLLSLPRPAELLSLWQVAGWSSWTFGQLLVSKLALRWMAKLENPQTEYWSPTNDHGRSRMVYLSDGGSIDNLGLLGLLRRKVRSAVVLISSGTPLLPRDVWDPSTPAGLANTSEHSVDDSINGLFGVGPAAGVGYNYTLNRVFDRSDYGRVINSLQQAQHDGSGAVAQTMLTTVANRHWGVEPGLPVMVGWVYVGRCRTWEKQLRPELSALVVPKDRPDDPTQTVSSGPFARFPHYRTAELKLTKPRANLLAELVGWIAQQHAPMLSQVMSYRDGYK